VRLARLTLAATVPGAVEPEFGLKLSHVALSLTDQLRVPPPVLVTLTVWAEGFAPPCTPTKLRLVGLRPIVGGTGAAVTVKLTGTVCGVFVAPVAVTVIVAL